MIDIGHFYGHTYEYWMELERRFNQPELYRDKPALLEEIIALRGRISFYESKIREMHELMEKKL